jgi:RNA ligase (TIGR02306 family)
MSRQLVTVRTINKILPIENADAVALAQVDGWQVVVKKNEFQVGDQALYFEIDSFIPLSDERFGFLTRGERMYNGNRGIRIKTIKLRGELSQGLLIPLDNFPDVKEGLKQGLEDFSDMLNVVKYEIDESGSLGGKPRGNFPSFIPKTDEKRVQNIVSAISNRQGESFEITMKMDGCSMTVYRKKQDDDTFHFGVCSRNNEMKEAEEGIEESNAYWMVARRERLEEALALFNGNWAMSGEMLGPKIQKNRENFKTYQFFVFNIFDIDAGHYVSPKIRHEMIKVMNDAGFDIKHVPVISTNHILKETVTELLEMAIGPSLNHPIREGLVFKSNDTLFSFKAISNKFLLKYEDDEG